jgi:hypothetical protein
MTPMIHLLPITRCLALQAATAPSFGPLTAVVTRAGVRVFLGARAPDPRA